MAAAAPHRGLGAWPPPLAAAPPLALAQASTRPFQFFAHPPPSSIAGAGSVSSAGTAFGNREHPLPWAPFRDGKQGGQSHSWAPPPPPPPPFQAVQQQAQQRQFDVRTSETFYGNMPVPPALSAAQAPCDMRNAETFVVAPAPPAPAHAGTHPVPLPRAPNHQQQQQQQHQQQQRPPEPQFDAGCSRPSRMDGIAKSAAPALFAPEVRTAPADTAETVANTKQKARELQFQIRLEIKQMEREARKMTAEEGRLHRRMQTEARRGNTQQAQLLAKTMVQSRKAAVRLQKTKASMQAVDLQVTESIASLSMRNCIKMSADAMKQMGGIARLPELERAVQEMHREASRCMQIEEILDEGLNDGDDLEEEMGAEVQKLLEELALDRQLDRLAVPAAPVPLTAAALASQTIPLTRVPGGGAPVAQWPPAQA